jgi:hypothetical protein
MVRFHQICTGIWVLLIIPTLIWWKDSILWVALMSVWANVISHGTAWQAARAEVAAKSNGSDAG